MSRRIQRTKAKEGVPTEDKEDSGSESSVLDKDLVMRLFEKMEKMEERFDRMDEKIEESIARAFENHAQGYEARFQQEATKLETMMDGKLEVLATEVSARPRGHQRAVCTHRQ